MVETSQYATTTKYIVKARFDVEGVVEKPDVVGAVFGQTEGLFGPDLDLRELQKSGRIGRIEINLDSKRDKTSGAIVIPSSLDKVSTAIIAAAIESVDRIGPCEARISLEKVEDVREAKRQVILTKAKDILRKWVVESSPSTEEVVKEVATSLRGADLITYGPEQLPAGPEVESPAIILVEGRADVILLMKVGIKNVVALNGTKVPDSIIKLTKDREVTAFLDGDRAGDLILKELNQVAEIDYVARAPFGREVEELTPKEIMRALRERVPVNLAKPIEKPQFPRLERPERSERGYGERSYTERAYGGQPEQVVRAPSPPTIEKPNLPPVIFDTAKDLRGTLEAVVFDETGKELSKMPVSELAEKIGSLENAHLVLFDGVVTQRLLDLAAGKNVKFVIGDRISEGAKKPMNVQVMTLSDLSSGPD
ncbi:MAG TPA: DNA primase DnaG [Candidatus Bathyarchaeia archaeon]|nr:DNA primase DnaG [Candidatus Bathyarchaeia archaeon]